MLAVTTSWDDGDILDIKLADLLDKYHIKGTFYITKNYRKQRLSNEQIKDISKRHEIGAHTLTHPDLCKISLEGKKEEINGSKKWLEDVLGHEVPMFCYPSGSYNEESIQVVKDSGFLGARTVEFGRIDLSSNAYHMPTTLQVYPMPFRKLDAHHYWWGELLQPFYQRVPKLRKLGVPLSSFRSFEVVARATFDVALQSGAIFHLWGHSWEIEKYGMWNEFERVLQFIGNQKDCEYVTNDHALKN